MSVSFSSIPATGNYTLITSTSPISLGVTPTINVPTGTRATFNFDTTDPNKLGLIVGSATYRRAGSIGLREIVASAGLQTRSPL